MKNMKKLWAALLALGMTYSRASWVGMACAMVRRNL